MANSFETRNYSRRESLARTGWSGNTFHKWAKVLGIHPVKKGWYAKNDIDTMLERVHTYNLVSGDPELLTLENLQHISQVNSPASIMVILAKGEINKVFTIEGDAFAIVPVPSGKTGEYIQKLASL